MCHKPKSNFHRREWGPAFDVISRFCFLTKCMVWTLLIHQLITPTCACVHTQKTWVNNWAHSCHHCWHRRKKILLMVLSTCLFRPVTPPYWGSAKSRIREQTENWGRAARSWMCVSSGWLYLWWSTSFPRWSLQTARKSSVMFVFFSALSKTEITPRSSFVVKKIHLIARINYNYVVFSSSCFLLHSCSRKLLYCRSPDQVCFCVIASIVKSPSCWSSGIQGISLEMWKRLAIR